MIFPSAHCSNDLCMLVKALFDDIDQLPLSIKKATIIVPDPSIQVWLIHQFARNNRSILPFEICVLADFISEFSPRALLPLLIGLLDAYDDRYTLAQKYLVPFAMRAFLGKKSSDPFVEYLFQQCASDFPYEPFEHHCPLILFGFSSLNKELFKRFVRSSVFRSLYFLSPCMLYWGDLVNDKQWDDLFVDRQCFLVHTGQVGRQFALLIEDSNLPVQQLYTLPQELVVFPYSEYLAHGYSTVSRKPTLLDYVRADLLLLSPQREDPVSIPRDSSIAVYVAQAPLTEVEALYQWLAQCPDLMPASVLVLTPDLRRYRALFEQVFGHLHQVWMEPKSSGPISAFRLLVNMLSTRAESKHFSQLLMHPYWRSAIGLDKQEAELIDSWLSGNPAWGLDQTYCQRYCEQRSLPYDKDCRTLEDLQNEYLDAFLHGDQRTQSSEAPIFGLFFAFLEKVQTIGGLPLGLTMTIGEYAKIFSVLLSICLHRKRGDREEEACAQALQTFQSIALRFPSIKIPFKEAWKIFDGTLDDAIRKNVVDMRAPIILAEFGHVQPFPVDYLALLGFDEQFFPQHDQEKLFSGISQMVSGAPASNVGVDRYCFVEAILSTKNLFIGYQRECSQVVAELINHIDSHYCIDEKLPSEVLLNKEILPMAQNYSIPLQNYSQLYWTQKESELSFNHIRMLGYAPLDFFFRKEFAYSIPKEEKIELFLKPWQGQHAFLKGASNVEGFERQSESVFQGLEDRLQEIDLVSITPVDLHCIPTVCQAHFEKDRILCPPLVLENGELVGMWPKLALEGTILFDEQWKRELFYRWPEVLVRSAVAKKFAIDIQETIYRVDHKTTLVPQIADAEKRLDRWLMFAHEAKEKPFPFIYEIVHLLVQRPSAAEVWDLILARAEREKQTGIWRLFSQEFSQDERLLEQWSRWAHDLWAEYFALVEGL